MEAYFLATNELFLLRTSQVILQRSAHYHLIICQAQPPLILLLGIKTIDPFKVELCFVYYFSSFPFLLLEITCQILSTFHCREYLNFFKHLVLLNSVRNESCMNSTRISCLYYTLPHLSEQNANSINLSHYLTVVGPLRNLSFEFNSS